MTVKIWVLVIGFLIGGEPQQYRQAFLTEQECLTNAMTYKVEMDNVHEVTCYEVKIPESRVRPVFGTKI